MKAPASLPFIHVALVEDDIFFSDSLVSALSTSHEIRLTGVARTRDEGLRLLDGPAADVLLVDLGLPDGSGIDVIHAAASKWPDCGIMVSTVFGDEAHVLRSIEAGASGYLLKGNTPQNMADAIRSLQSGGSPVSPLIARQILRRFRGQDAVAPVRTPAVPPPASVLPYPSPAAVPAMPYPTLSTREHEVLELITKGFTYGEIAGLMQISNHTVTTFVRRVYAKLKVKSKAEAIYEGYAQGLLGSAAGKASRQTAE